MDDLKRPPKIQPLTHVTGFTWHRVLLLFSDSTHFKKLTIGKNCVNRVNVVIAAKISGQGCDLARGAGLPVNGGWSGHRRTGQIAS